MRGFFATLSLIVAIGGLLVVIGYGASKAYLDLRSEEADLYDDLLMGLVVPGDWVAVRAAEVDYREQFVTPCLQTPLLEGVSFKGRGAAVYRPEGGANAGIQALMLQTSTSDAQAIIDDIGRDTENDCQRGVTVGTVEAASSESLDLSPGGEAIFVTYSQQSGDQAVEYESVLFRDGEYVGRLIYDKTASEDIAESDIIELAGALASNADTPPTTAELEAAGIIDEPTPIEQLAERTRSETSSMLTASGQIPVELGLAAVGGMVLLLYFLGARLSRTAEPLVASNPSRVSSTGNPTLDSYGAANRETLHSYAASSPGERESAPESEDADEAEAAGSTGHRNHEDVSDPPPPILNFPQKPIEEKLKILKEARLREPKREHRALREVRPDVDWTEEISKPQPKKETESSEGQAVPQVSRKILLQKLRSNQP